MAERLTPEQEAAIRERDSWLQITRTMTETDRDRRALLAALDAIRAERDELEEQYNDLLASVGGVSPR